MQDFYKKEKDEYDKANKKRVTRPPARKWKSKFYIFWYLLLINSHQNRFKQELNIMENINDVKKSVRSCLNKYKYKMEMEEVTLF